LLLLLLLSLRQCRGKFGRHHHFHGRCCMVLGGPELKEHVQDLPGQVVKR
jgi:hypothetical protein